MARIYDSNTKTLDIFIYGDIAQSNMRWESMCYTPYEMLDDLRAAQNYEVRNINIHISSGGGDIFAGFEIYNLIQIYAQKYTLTACIQGICASTATLIASAAAKVFMSEVSLYMIHQPTASVSGASAEEMRKLADVVDKVKQILINKYVAKTGKTEAEIRTVVDVETWYTPQEALASGFVDEIYKDKYAPIGVNPTTLRNQLQDKAFSLYNVYKFTIPMTPEEQKEMERLKAENAALLLQQSDLLLSNAVATGKITAENKVSYLALGMSYLQLQGLLATFPEKKAETPPKIPPVTNTLTAQIIAANFSGTTPNAADRTNWTYQQWRDNDLNGLKDLENKNPIAFNALANAYQLAMQAKSGKRVS